MTDEPRATAKASLFGRFWCMLGAFPAAAYAQLGSAALRGRVVMRGLAVIVSPLAFTLALASNGQRFVGHTPYLFLLPIAVVAIEWLLIASTYTPTQRLGGLRFVRSAILLVSASLAVLAGVLSEPENLLRAKHRAEDAETAQSRAWRALEVRSEATDAKIAANEEKLRERDSVELALANSRRLEKLECGGTTGLDPQTGIFIKGGSKCGPRAANHRTNAEAAEARLASLTRLAEENQRLATEQGEIKQAFEDLLATGRSPSDSVATLLRALKDADAGLWAKISIMFFLIVLTEAFTLAVAAIPVPEPLRSAAEINLEIVQLRLQAWRDAERAEIARQRATDRTQAADGLAPMEVKLTAARPENQSGKPLPAETPSDRSPDP